MYLLAIILKALWQFNYSKITRKQILYNIKYSLIGRSLALFTLCFTFLPISPSCHISMRVYR